MFDQESLLPRYRALRKQADWVNALTIWTVLAVATLFVVCLCFVDQLRSLLSASARSVQGVTIAAAIVLILLVVANRVQNHRLARRWNLLCPQCRRPLSHATIVYALDQGLCWHCSPPVAAVAVDPPRGAHGPLPPAIESNNPYQPPQVTDAQQNSAAAERATNSGATNVPVGATVDLNFSVAMYCGPLAGIIIYNCLFGSDEASWQINRLPGAAYKTAAAEAEHRRAVLRSKRLLGWYFLGWMVTIPGLAIWAASLLPANMPTFYHRIVYYGLVFVLSSGMAFWLANKLPLVSPHWLRRLIFGLRPTNAEREAETGLVCVQLTFAKQNLSPIVASRTIRFRWKANDSAPLRVCLWQRGRGIIHEQELPAAPSGQWQPTQAVIPFGAAGRGARLSDLKVLFAVDPPGTLEVDDMRV